MSRIRNNLDLAWKEALTGYLPEFLALFQPHVHEAIDWTHPVEFLESEARRLRRPPRGCPWTLRGQRKQVDLLAKVRLRGGVDALVLIHVEVQAQKDPDLPLRMRLYHDRLFDLHALPVFSLAVLADPSPTWRPDRHEVEIWGCRSTLVFPTIKLLDWRERREELEGSQNPFALVVAAHLAVLETRPDQPARLERALRLVRLLLERGFSREQIDGLFHVLEVMMPMSDKLAEIFEKEVTRLDERHSVLPMSRFELRGLEKGRAEGEREGQRMAIQRFALARFHQLPEELEQALEAVADLEALSRLVDVAATAATAADLLEAARRESDSGR